MSEMLHEMSELALWELIRTVLDPNTGTDELEREYEWLNRVWWEEHNIAWQCFASLYGVTCAGVLQAMAKHPNITPAMGAFLSFYFGQEVATNPAVWLWSLEDGYVGLPQFAPVVRHAVYGAAGVGLQTAEP